MGTLPALLEAFPTAQVAMHILEAPYAGGGASYWKVPTDNWSYAVLRRLLPDTNLHLPKERLLFLSGTHVFSHCLLDQDMSRAEKRAACDPCTALHWCP